MNEWINLKKWWLNDLNKHSDTQSGIKINIIIIINLVKYGEIIFYDHINVGMFWKCNRYNCK